MKKEILDRLTNLERKFIIQNFNEEDIDNLIHILESILEYEIKDRIKYNEIDYRDIERSIFNVLTLDELRYVIDSQMGLK